MSDKKEWGPPPLSAYFGPGGAALAEDLFLRRGTLAPSQSAIFDATTEVMIKARRRFMQLGDQAMADEIENFLKAAGIGLTDTPEGTRWHNLPRE